MKERLSSIIKTLFPEDLFDVFERHEKIGALYYEVRDKQSSGSNLWASFFVYDDEPDTVSIEINNVMRKAHIEEVRDAVIEAIDKAIELREKMAKLRESKEKLIQLEKERKENNDSLRDTTEGNSTAK